MAPRAQVNSIEAIEAFRARLVVYAAQARAALDECGSEVIRTRLWLENDQRSLIEAILRRCDRSVQETQQALFSARISSLQTECSAEQLAAHRARQARDEAEARLRRLKHWSGDYDNRVQPLVKEVEKLHSILSFDLVQAAASLSQTVRALSDYADLRSVSSTLENPAQPPAAVEPPSAAGSGPADTKV